MKPRILIKAQVHGYTRRNGTFVHNYEANRRQLVLFGLHGQPMVPAAPKTKVRAGGFLEDMRIKGSTMLLGKRIDVAQDLAEMAQIFRDPRAETFRVFYVKQGKVIHATAVSSRMAAQSSITIGLSTPNEMFASFGKEKKRVGADGYWLLHNHPTGRPAPSRADVQLTISAAQRSKGFLGHVIINSKQFATIDRRGVEEIHDLPHPGRPFEHAVKSSVLGMPATDPEEMAAAAKHVTATPGNLLLIGRRADGTVGGVLEFKASLLDHAARFRALARRYARLSGSIDVAVAGAQSYGPDIEKMIEDGYLLDAVNKNGTSLRSKLPLVINGLKFGTTGEKRARNIHG